MLADLEAPLTVRFDGQVATCTELSAYELECLTPPGNNAGLVDVVVEDSSGATLNLDQSYRYIDLGDLSLSPEDGAVAGNTALRLSGPNLAQTIEGAQVTLKFDGLSAMQIEASSDAGLDFRTPRSATEGSRNVSITIDGYTFETPLNYTYFDPSTAPT